MRSNEVRVRFADYRELPKLLVLLQSAYAESEYAGRIPVDVDRGRKTLARLLNPSQKGTCVLVLEVDGDIQGALLGMVEHHWWNRYRFATDLLTYCAPEARGYGHRLLQRFVHWAKRQPGVAEISLAASTSMVDPQRLERLFERLGFERTGMIWTLFVEPH